MPDVADDASLQLWVLEYCGLPDHLPRTCGEPIGVNREGVGEDSQGDIAASFVAWTCGVPLAEEAVTASCPSRVPGLTGMFSWSRRSGYSTQAVPETRRPESPRTVLNMGDDPSVVSALTNDFLRVSRRQLQVRVQRIETCLGRLSDEQIWLRRHEVENAVGNLVLHLCGNISQWIVGGVGGASVSRDRDAEFARREPLPADDLVRRLQAVVGDADAVLAGLTPGALVEPRRIQGYEVTVLQAVYHVVEHLAEHTGQIIWATKGLTGDDLGFYTHLHEQDRTSGDQP